ncbi:MAG: M48 family metalloprotease [Myxococcota bacterium]
MALVLLVANLLHGAVSLVWMLGVSRLAKPLPAELWMHLLGLTLVLPPLLALARLLGAGVGAEASLVRADLWAAWIAAEPAVTVAGLVLVGGTLIAFLVQEVRPLLARRRRHGRPPRRRDPALERVLQDVLDRFRAAGVRLPPGHRLRAIRLDTDERIAALEGIVEPAVVISRGLLDVLEDRELEAIIAHEVAHHVQGGNRRMVIAWIARAVQALNPAALVIFRMLVEAREVAADALAASVTGKPATLASVLLALHGPRRDYGGRGGPVARARHEVLRRAERAGVRLRVETLLHPDARPTAPAPITILATLSLLGLLWGIG